MLIAVVGFLTGKEDKAFIWWQRGCDSAPKRHTTGVESSRWPNNQVDEKCGRSSPHSP